MATTYTVTLTLVTDEPLEQPDHVKAELEWAIDNHLKVEGLTHECDPGIVTDFTVSELVD